METVICSDPLPLQMGGFRTFESLLFEGKYTEIDPRITKDAFAWPFVEEYVDRVRLLQFSRNPTTSEVVEEFSNFGLIPPVPQHAFAFGAEYRELVQMPDAGRRGPIVFLHEPYFFPRGNQAPWGDLGILVLSESLASKHLPAMKSLMLEWINLPHASPVKPAKDHDGKDIQRSDELGYGWRNAANRWQACWGCRFLGVER